MTQNGSILATAETSTVYHSGGCSHSVSCLTAIVPTCSWKGRETCSQCRRGSYTKSFLWESIVTAALFSTLYLITLIMVYIKLRKIDKNISVHKAKRRPGLRTKKTNNMQEAGKELGSQKMPASQPTHFSLWLKEQAQSQTALRPNAQINSCPQKGSCSELSSHSGQHSDSDDVNYTTITFPVPKQGISKGGGFRD